MGGEVPLVSAKTKLQLLVERCSELQMGNVGVAQGDVQNIHLPSPTSQVTK